MTVIDLLCDLVRIPSVNPDGDPGTDRVGERACAEFIADFLRDLGAEVTLDEVFPGRPNVVGRFPAPGQKPRLLFAPHTDTVSVVGMTIDPFGGEVRDGKIWGRGASDTKGPMAAMLFALRECRDILPSLSHEIWFAGLMGEETGQHGSKALAAREKFDLAIVGEPTKLEIVHTHKGSTWMTFRTRGRAFHASAPDKGDNAIGKMLAVLTALQADFSAAFATMRDPVLGSPTFNIGTISGGSKINIVPDFCEARVDVRTIPGQDLAPLLDALRGRFPGLEIDVQQSLPLHTDINHPVIKILESCGAPRAGAPWFCDAAWFSAAGTPAVALGPGSIAQAHTCDEWMAVADLEDGVTFFKKFLQKLQ